MYEAKGIETVRRDGCPAVAKILEKCLRTVNGRIANFIESNHDSPIKLAQVVFIFLA